MIKLTKRQEPEVLRQNKDQWTREYKEAKIERKKDPDRYHEAKYKYRHSDIKEQILLETHEKCAYCESNMRHVHPGEIEHIKPVAEDDDCLFDWDNLTLGCTECNRRKSANYDEEVGIINPYHEDPEDHIESVGALVFPKAGDAVGRVACELFELNRPALAEQRKDRVEKMELELSLFASAPSEIERKLWERRLNDEMLDEKPFQLVTRAYIKPRIREIKKKQQ